MSDDPGSLPYRPNVGIMLVNPAGQVFTAQRADAAPGVEAWQMPQGGIDPGEDPRQAALRELEEETGITPELVEIVAESPGWLRYDLPPELQGRLWGGKWRGQEQKWFLMRFLGRDDQIDIHAHTPEFTTWRWSPVAELVPSIVPFKRPVYEKVIEMFRPHLQEPFGDPSGGPGPFQAGRT